MADNIPVIPGTGGDPIVSTDDVGGVHYQRVKIDLGDNGATAPLLGNASTSGANRLPVDERDGLALSGSVSSAATLFTQDMLGYESASVQVTSAGVGCTITYETSDDNTNWLNAIGMQIASTGTSGGASASTTAIGMKFSRILRYFRARVSTYGSGTVTVVGTLSKAPITQMVAALAQGAVAHDAPVAGTPVRAAGRARTFGTPYTAVAADDTTDLVTDLSGNLKTTQEYSYSHISTATTTTVKSGAGVLHSISVNTKGTVASIATVYDNTAGSGTVIAVIDTLNLSGPFVFDVVFATGLTIVTTGTTAPDLTVSYR